MRLYPIHTVYSTKKEAQFPPRSKERGLHCEDLMILENWVVSASKFKRAVLAVTDHLVTRVNLEPLEDHEGTVGVKAVWEGERGESTLNVNAPSLKGNIKTAGDKAPTVEYWQQGDNAALHCEIREVSPVNSTKKRSRKLRQAKQRGLQSLPVPLLDWLAGVP